MTSANVAEINTGVTKVGWGGNVPQYDRFSHSLYENAGDQIVKVNALFTFIR